MKRGDVVTVALQGDLGEPRPALIVETDVLAPAQHVLVCPGTGFIAEHSPNRRRLVQPNAENGLRQPTQFQIDKLIAVRRDKCGAVIGRLTDSEMEAISRMLIVLLGLAD